MQTASGLIGKRLPTATALYEEHGKVVDDGTRQAAANAPSLFRRAAHGVALDIEQPPDPLQRLVRDRRVGRDMDVVELAAHVGPARDLGDRGRLPAGALVERAKAE